jgi:hypothetical protein
MCDYMKDHYVNVGAPYEMSIQATQIYNDAHTTQKILLNAPTDTTVILGGMKYRK